METLSKDALIRAYRKAIELDLSGHFIALVERELVRRHLLEEVRKGRKLRRRRSRLYLV